MITRQGWIRVALTAVMLTLALALDTSAASTTKTTTFTVSLTITADCSISANPLSFGSSGVFAAAINQTTTLSVTCTNTTPYNIGLDAGSVAGSTVAARLLSSGAATLLFQMYSDAGRSVIWGNTVGTNTVTGTGNGSAQSLTVYGQVPVQALPAPNAYTSTVTASVIF